MIKFIKYDTETGKNELDEHGLYYVHTQITAADEWIINHNLGKKPALTIINSEGLRCFGQETHTSDNQLKLNFNSAFSGTAICN